MNYEFSFYKERDFDEIETMILDFYTWDYPIWGISRHEFTLGLHPSFTGISRAWQRTAGIFRQGGKIAACAIHEANDEGNVFFLFDSEQRAGEPELLEEMLFFAKTSMSSVQEDRMTRYVNLRVPKWNKALRGLAEQAGFQANGDMEKINILPFPDGEFPVVLPQGYSFADGTMTPDYYLSNVHMGAFNYGIGNVKNSEQAFHELRIMRHYQPELDLCILDPRKRPVAMAVLWVDQAMPYCELEPLGVVWWERRKRLATAILHEGANRVKHMYPQCQGMLGGNQPFYEKSGYVTKAEIPVLHWERTIYPSWDPRSDEKNPQGTSPSVRV